LKTIKDLLGKRERERERKKRREERRKKRFPDFLISKHFS